MRFMNEYDIADASRRYSQHPVLGPATATLVQLMQWANSNSDGWVYWPRPCRAAAKLIELIEAHEDWERSQYTHPRDGAEATAAQYKKALSPIKAFRTRQNANFIIVPTQ